MGTGLLTPRGLLSRDLESFPAFFRGPKGTFKVPPAPRTISGEMESAGTLAGSAETVAGLAENAKRRERPLSAFSVNPRVAGVRYRSSSSAVGTHVERSAVRV